MKRELTYDEIEALESAIYRMKQEEAITDKEMLPDGAVLLITRNIRILEKLRRELAPRYVATHVFTGYDIQEGEGGTEHPLANLTCEVMQRYGGSKAGYDTTVRLPLHIALAAYKHRDEKYDWMKCWNECGNIIDGYLYCEADEGNELRKL